jgi:hypothetical protein
VTVPVPVPGVDPGGVQHGERVQLERRPAGLGTDAVPCGDVVLLAWRMARDAGLGSTLGAAPGEGVVVDGREGRVLGHAFMMPF